MKHVKPLRILMTLVLVALVVGCDSRRRAAEGTIFSFVEAVQTEDLDALRCSLAGAAQRYGPITWILKMIGVAPSRP